MLINRLHYYAWSLVRLWSLGGWWQKFEDVVFDTNFFNKVLLLTHGVLPPTLTSSKRLVIGKIWVRKISYYNLGLWMTSTSSCCYQIFILLKQFFNHLYAVLLFLDVCWSTKRWSIRVLLLIFLGIKCMVILIILLCTILLLICVRMRRENVLLLVLFL